jgi:transposase-like protein
MTPPHSLTVAELASQKGISTAILYNWRKAAKERGAVLGNGQPQSTLGDFLSDFNTER